MRTLIRKLTYMAILTLALSVASALPARASAMTFTANVNIPLDGFTVFVPCAAGGAGELIVLNGSLHDLFHITVDDLGGVHVKLHDNPQSLSGLGQTTGAKYQGTGVTQEEFNLNGHGLPSTDTFVDNFRMIGQGPGNNFMVHENAHITINANGVVTVVVDNLSVTCQ